MTRYKLILTWIYLAVWLFAAYAAIKAFAAPELHEKRTCEPEPRKLRPTKLR